MSKVKKRILCDYETSGTNHLFDQPLSFCAKVFDENGQEIDSIKTNCRMEKSRLPSPIALSINQYPLQNLLQAQSLRDMMVEINLFFKSMRISLIVVSKDDQSSETLVGRRRRRRRSRSWGGVSCRLGEV